MRRRRSWWWVGSLRVAVPVLVTIAAVLAWGTFYEARFGTAAVQRAVYQSWWFQLLLGFLAVNLASAALKRRPWKPRHLPFLLAHLGIITMLVGGVIGGRFGLDGQLIIPEGEASNRLELNRRTLIIHHPGSDMTMVIPTDFETRAWVQEPNRTVTIPLEPPGQARASARPPRGGRHPAHPLADLRPMGPRPRPAANGGVGDRVLQVTVARYLPDAQAEEVIAGDGPEEAPAVRVRLAHGEQAQSVWLLARDPERFGVGWGEARVLFLEAADDSQLAQLLGRAVSAVHPRGVVSVRLAQATAVHEIPVPEDLSQTVAIPETPYRLTFRDYFPDFALTEQGLVSRSSEPNNPAVSFTLSGPEGTDAHLAFARHPDFPALHGFTHVIPAEVRYTHAASAALPPNAIAIVRGPSTTLAAAKPTPHGGEAGLAAVMTGTSGERQVVEPVAVGAAYTHPWLAYQFAVEAHEPKATLTRQMRWRSQEVRAEALWVVVRLGDHTAEGWVSLHDAARLMVAGEPIVVEYRPAQRELPVTMKLLDFRKTTYPGTQMAAGFESDVQLSDPTRGLILVRKISMNQPLRYRGYHFYQSSYIEGPPETTVLSVRNDPGTPLVYAGFLTVIAGIVSLFVTRRAAGRSRPASRRR